MRFIRNNLANFITITRIGLAISLIFLELFSIEFFVIYGLCGISDVLDGYVARKLNISTKFGSLLDSLSDWFYFVVLAVKLLPTMQRLLPVISWVLIFVAFFFHMCAYIICYFKFKKFSALHTYMNKLMSFAIFCLPFVFIGEIQNLYCIYTYIGGSFAVYGSIELCFIHLYAKEYDLKNKSLYRVFKNQKEIQEKNC